MTGRFELLRGHVCRYNFGAAAGSLPNKIGPVVVMQGNQYNRSELRTTLVTPLTSELGRATFANNVFVPAAESGLPKDSVALPYQMTAVNKQI
ncbi:MAG: type II toxin-antitoxin system PemK/MazF family toxin [Promicromonosporaceae bacterium]|nr:type II toxin-antitoxin system PemK/MazF family toxin [Promicromonosporaceae bacterium]